MTKRSLSTKRNKNLWSVIIMENEKCKEDQSVDNWFFTPGTSVDIVLGPFDDAVEAKQLAKVWWNDQCLIDACPGKKGTWRLGI